MRWRLVRFVVALVAALALLLIVLVWLLGQGPIRLAMLDRPIAAALGSLGPDLVVEIGGTELIRMGRGVAIRVKGLRLRRHDGTALLALPEVAIRPRLRQLVRGRFAVGGVHLGGVQLALTRTSDGELRLGTEAGEAGIALGALLGGNGTTTASEDPPPRIALERGRVTFDDRVARTRAALSNATLTVLPARDRLDATFAGTLELAGDTPPLRGAVTLAVQARASALLAEGQVGATTFSLAADHGSLVPPAGGDPLTLGAVAVEGTYDPTTSDLALTRLVADVGGSRLDGTTTMRLGATTSVSADATVDALPVDSLTRLWPAELATTARTWVAENVRAGRLHDCRVRVAVPGPGMEAPPISGDATSPSLAASPPSTLDVGCAFDGVDADYLPPLEPVRDGVGAARITTDRLVVDLGSGTAGGCRIDGATFTLDFAVEPPRAAITADVSGTGADVLALVDRPPLGIGAMIGIAPRDLGGESRVHAALTLPLKAGLRRDEIGISATAALEDASVPELVAGLGIEHGRLDVEVAGDRIEVTGKTVITGVKDVTAPVDVTLAVEPGKAPASQAARLSVTGDGVALDGTATLRSSTVDAAVVERLRLGGHDLAGKVERGRDGEYVVILDGARLDLASLIASTDGTGSQAADLDARFAVQLGRVRITPEIELQNVRGTVRTAGGRIAGLDLTASLDPGNLRATLAERDGKSTLTVTSDQADRALRAVGFQQFSGGTLALTARTDERGVLAFLEGELSVKDFKVVRAPQLAKVLAIGSLGGMASLIQGEGLPFKEARFPFYWEGERLSLYDVRAIGAIGITADGTIETGARTCDVGGSIIPSYTMNTALGRIPLLGKIVGGDRGIFGIAYGIKGGLDDPTVRVNPLTAIAPGILRTWLVEPFTRRDHPR